MAFKHQYTILCDDVRAEDNGKLIIIGFYSEKVLIPQIPFVFSSLAFFQVFKAEEVGRHTFRAKLLYLDGSKELATAMGQITVSNLGISISVVKFGNIKIDASGSYLFQVIFDGQDVSIDFHFDVELRV